MPAAVSYRIEKVTLQPADGLAIRATLPVGQLPEFFGQALTEMAAWITSQAGEAAFGGPPFARYYSVDPAAIDVEAIFPLTQAVPGSGRMQAVLLDGGDAVQVLHVGPYDQMEPAYEAVQAWLRDTGHLATEPPREVYLSDPAVDPDPLTWRTLVVQPYR